MHVGTFIGKKGQPHWTEVHFYHFDHLYAAAGRGQSKMEARKYGPRGTPVAWTCDFFHFFWLM